MSNHLATLSPEAMSRQQAGATHDLAPGAVVRPRIASLDGLRGLAVLLVMCCHFGEGGGGWVLRAAQAGWVGVDLFFVLSGFLITGILLEARAEPGYFRNFYMRRVLRIFPLYYVVLVSVFVLAPALGLAGWLRLDRSASHQAWLWSYGTNIGQSLFDDWLFNVGRLRLHHLWSLAVEEHFYLLWPAVVLLCGRRALGWVCVVLIVSAPVLRLVMTGLECSAIGIYVLTPCRWDALAMGAGLSLLAGRPSPLLRRWARVSAPGLGAVLVVLFVWRGGLDNINDPVVQTAGLTLLGATWAGVLVLVLGASPHSALARLLGGPVLGGLGRISYGLYVVHLPVLSLLSRWIWPRRIADVVGSELAAHTVVAAIAMSCSIGVAWLSYRYLESPFLRLKRHFGGAG